MRVETLYVHCLRPDRPDGTVFTGELDVVSNGGLAAPQVIDKVSGEKLCSLPLDRANRLDRLAKSGRISYKVVCVGPWRHKQYVSARMQVVLNDVRRILDGRLSAVSLWAGGEWIQSDFCACSLSSTAEWNEVIKLIGPIHREFRKKLDESPGVVKVENWLPEKAFQIHGGSAGRNAFF